VSAGFVNLPSVNCGWQNHRRELNGLAHSIDVEANEVSNTSGQGESGDFTQYVTAIVKWP
jgi:hypothetical protein